ncbi:MAG: hypothetical protein ACREB3_04435 [Burkholderiales bacterium]
MVAMTGFHGIAGGLLFLALGIVELVVLRRTLYPALRWRYEKAKLTQSQGVGPDLIINVLRFQSLVLMPVAGFLLGERLGP